MIFKLIFLLMLHHKFARTVHVLLCKYDRWKLKNVETEINNIPYKDSALLMTPSFILDFQEGKNVLIIVRA